MDFDALAASIALLLLGFLAVFQLALAAGAPLGRFAWGGQQRVLPPKLRVGSVVSVGIYGVLALFAVSEAGWWVVVTDPSVLRTGLWVIAVYLASGIVLNALSRSKPERYLMTPVAALLAGCFFVLALG